MAIVTAKLSNYRQSPRKVRLVATLVAGMPVTDALAELSVRGKRAAPYITKLIKSAVANAKEAGLNERVLIVKELRVDKGAVMKRWMPRAQGRAARINKRSSHIVVTLAEKDSGNIAGQKAKSEDKKQANATSVKKQKVSST